MIEYDAMRDAYIIHYSDDSCINGWIRELNGSVFIGINTNFRGNPDKLIADLFSDENEKLRREMFVYAY